MEELHPSVKSKGQIVTLIACAGMIAFALGMHILESWMLIVPTVMVIIGIVVAILAAFLWDKVPAFRRFVRVAVIALPSVVIALAIASIVEGMIVDPYTTLGYEIATYGTMALQFAQTFIVCMLPMAVTAAAYGYRFDRFLLLAMAAVNLAAVVYFMLSAIPNGYMSADEKSTTLQTLYMLYTAVTTLLCIIVAGKGLWHLPKSRKNKATD